MSTENSERLKLAQAAQMLLDECRMVLPGIQALFGFQLVAVFNTRFAEELTSSEQRLHFVSILLVVVAIVCVMAPAAYHRQLGTHTVTERFLSIATRLLFWGLWPLVLALSFDIYLSADSPLAVRSSPSPPPLELLCGP
jgi:cytochrome bd-type quinol oxidase subunit 2